jgi:hypothetical protein
LWEFDEKHPKQDSAYRTHVLGYSQHSQPSLGDSLLDWQVLTQIVGPPMGNSTLNDVQREAGERSLLVARLHIEAGLVHRLDDLIERDLVAF